MRLLVAAVLFLSAACAPHGPVVDAGPKPEGVGGTIAGIVRAGDMPLSARTVTAVDTATGARYQASTAMNGGYTMKVPPGTYRLELELHAGESIARQPDTTQVNVGDLDPDRNFVVTVARR